MKLRKCPKCNNYLNEDELEVWCSYCDYIKAKEIKPDWSWTDD